MRIDDKGIDLDNIDESEMEGARSFFKMQLDEMVLPYIYNKKIMIKDKDNPIYQEYLDINVDADRLVEICGSNIKDNEKRALAKKLLNALYLRTNNLITKVLDDEQNDNHDDYHRFK